MADTHIINGKGTSIGHSVHYTDQSGEKHAALLKKITPPEQTSSGSFEAHLHKFDKNDGSDSHLPNVQYSTSGYPNTWNHIS